MEATDPVQAKRRAAREYQQRAVEAARIKREKRDAADDLWHAVRYSPTDVGALTALAKAIPAHHPDGEAAVERLRLEYASESDSIDPAGFHAAYHLDVLAAKIAFCDALIEAARAHPEPGRVAELARSVLAVYEHFDAEDVRQDLHSLRKADVQAAEARRKAEAEAETKRRAEEQAAAAKAERPASEQPVERGQLWEFEAGLYRFNGKSYDLTMVPLAILRVFVRSRRDALAKVEIKHELGDHGDMEDSTLKSHISTLRQSLRQAAKDAGLSAEVQADPLMHKSGGWRFLMPKR